MRNASRLGVVGIACMILFLASLASCLNTRPEPRWTEGTVEAVSDKILWNVTIEALQKADFPIGTGVDRSRLKAVSGWATHLAPFKGDGFRERCTIEYTPLDGRKYAVKVRVEREHNQDIVRPLDGSYADWEAVPDDVERARLVLAFVKGMLGPEFELRSRAAPSPVKRD